MTNSRPTVSTCHLYFLGRALCGQSHFMNFTPVYLLRLLLLLFLLLPSSLEILSKVFREPGGKSWSDLWLIGVDSQFYLGLIFSVFNLFFFECLIVNVITIGYCFIYLLLFNPIDGVIPLIACAQFVLLINYAWFETRMTVKIRSETWSFAWVLLIKGSRVS